MRTRFHMLLGYPLLTIRHSKQIRPSDMDQRKADSPLVPRELLCAREVSVPLSAPEKDALSHQHPSNRRAIRCWSDRAASIALGATRERVAVVLDQPAHLHAGTACRSALPAAQYS